MRINRLGVKVGKRHFFRRDDQHLSYVDFGGTGRPLVVLHGHFGCARNFALLAEALAPTWRVFALDQRGHGWSDHSQDVSRDAYVEDAVAFFEHLGLEETPILGHSLGGINALCLAAQKPVLVSQLIIEDITPVVPTPAQAFAIDWPKRFGSLSSLLEFLDSRGLSGDRHFLDSITEDEHGWGFRFDPEWINLSQEALNGDWTERWARVSCPVLLIYGRQSRVTGDKAVARLPQIRAPLKIVALNGGHTLHDEEPDSFAQTVRDYLKR